MKKIVKQRFLTNLVFIISLLIFLSIGYISYTNASNWITTIDLVAQTRETLLSCQKIISLSQEAETSQRGYLLSGDTTFLPPYSVAVAATEDELQKIRYLHINNPTISRRLERIERLVEKRIALLKKNIEIRNRQGPEAVLRQLKTREGDKVMEVLQREIAKLSTDENFMLHTYKRDANQISSIAKLTIISGTIVSIALILWAFFSLHQQMDKRDLAMNALTFLNETLETKVQERTNELQSSLQQLAANNEILNKSHQQQKALLEQLRKSEQLLQEIYDGSADALFLLKSSSFEVENYNQQAVELFEFTDKEEFVGQGLLSLHKKTFSDVQQEVMFNQIAEKKHWRGEIEYISQAGRTFWGDVAISLLSVDGKEYYLARIRDVTDRKNVERVIHQGQLELIKQQLLTKRALATIEEDNLRKTKELEEARTLQLSMLPHEAPVLDNVEMAMTMQTATEVGGDYYDYKIAEDNTLTVIIGDATGHGLKAGIVVATVKSYFQTLANQYNAVDLLKRLSEGIQNLQIRSMYMGITLIKIKNDEVTIASSGMPPLYLYKHAANTIESIMLKGLFLGSSLDASYQHVSRKLQQGDTLFTMTDGLAELFNQNREMLNYERIEAHFAQVAASTPDQIINQMIALGEDWTAGKPIEDDITLLVIKAK